MSHQLYTDETPAEVKNAKVREHADLGTLMPPLTRTLQGLHLITMSTPNGQPVQILLEELKDIYGTEWTTTLINIMNNEVPHSILARIGWSGH